MTKKQMSARIAELESVVAALTLALNVAQHPIYVGPLPAAPTINPMPIPYIGPYIGDPMPRWNEPNWGGTSTPNPGGILCQGGGNITAGRSDVLCINSTLSGGSDVALEGKPLCRSANL